MDRNTVLWKVKGAFLAWLLLNIFLVPALANTGTPEGASQVLSSQVQDIGAFAKIKGTGGMGGAEEMSYVKSASTIDYHSGGRLAILLYAIVVLAFVIIVSQVRMELLTEMTIAKSAFAVGLMIAIPVFSSRALGGINSITIFGDDEIENYFKPINNMTITMNVTVPGDENITKDQLMLVFGSETMKFTQCKDSNGTLGCLPGGDNYTAICECKHILGSTNNPLVNPSYSMRLELYTDTNPISPMSYDIEQVFMDDKAPIFSQPANGDPLVIKQIEDKATVTVSVADKSIANDGNGNPVCAGISKVEFYSNNVLQSADTITVDQEAGNCSRFEKTINLSMSESGLKNITAKVCDNLGNCANKTKELFLDFDKPEIDGTFKVIQGGREIEYMSTVGPTAGLRDASIEVTIVEHELDKLYANLSGLNDNFLYSDRYKNISVNAATCEHEDDTYTCRITGDLVPQERGEDIFIHTQSTNLAINLTAVDKMGLTSTRTVTADLILDNDRPQVSKLGTFSCNAERCFVKDGTNTWLAEMVESQSGFDHSLVWINTGTVTGLSNSTRLYCTDAGDKWRCWGTTPSIKPSLTDGHVYRVVMDYKSTDDAGNALAGQVESLVEVDKTAPVIDVNNSYAISVQTDGRRTYYHLSGNDLMVFVKGTDSGSGVVSEDGKWTARIKAGDIIQDPAENTTWIDADLCFQDSNGTFDCRWQIGPLIDGPFELQDGLEVEIVDVAGNKLSANLFDPFIIYAVAQSSPGEVWSVDQSTVECMPEYFDRSLTKYYPGGNKIWCKFNLDASSQYVALSIDQAGECLPSNLTDDYFESSRLFGNQMLSSEGVEGPITLYTIFDFEKSTIDPHVNEFAFICPYEITFAKKHPRTIYEPQEFNVSLTIPVSGGNADLESAVQENVDRVKAHLRGSKWIAKLQHVMQVLRNTCQILYSIESIINGFLAAAGLLDWIPYWNIKNIIGEGASKSSWVRDGLFGSLFEACAYISCQKNILELAYKSGSTTKYQNFVKKWIGLVKGDFRLLPGVNNVSVGTDAVANVITDQLSTVKPEESIIFSALQLCIPGVFYNMMKARQIDCYYVFCMEKLVPVGKPAYACASERYLMYCNFVIGQFFAIFPFTALIEGLGDIAAEVFSDPFAALGFAYGSVVCGRTWEWGFLSSAYVCDKPMAIAQALSVGKMLGSQFENWNNNEDFCDEVGI